MNIHYARKYPATYHVRYSIQLHYKWLETVTLRKSARVTFVIDNPLRYSERGICCHLH